MLSGSVASCEDRSRSFGFQAWLDLLLAARAWTDGLHCKHPVTRLAVWVNFSFSWLFSMKYLNVFELDGKIVLKF